MNQIWLIGRISNEPDFKSGNTDGRRWYLARFDIAVQKKKGGRNVKNEEMVDYFHIQASGGYATMIKDYAVKGTKLSIRGEVHNSSYTNRKGHTVKQDMVFPDLIEFCESKEIQNKWLESKEGQRFLNEFCDKSDAANTMAPMVAEFEVDSSELPFG